MPRTPDGTRRQNRRDEKRQRGKPALPQRATCVCSCSKSSRVSTSNSSHSLETSMVRTHSACVFATNPPPLPRGRERSSSNAHEGKSTGAPGTPSKLVRQMRATPRPAASRPAASRLAAPAASRSAARRSAAMLAGRISGWSPWTNVTVSHPSMASMPRRTVSFRQGLSCKITCAPSVSHNAATSAWRVTTTRRLNKPSVARTTWPTSGAPQSSAISLLPPKRAPTPDAITMHPCFNVRLSAACGIAVFAFANSMVGRAEFEN